MEMNETQLPAHMYFIVLFFIAEMFETYTEAHFSTFFARRASGKIAQNLCRGNCTRSSKLDYFISEVIKIEANRRDFGINKINYQEYDSVSGDTKK